jgi:hypothetical protein
MVIAQEPAQSLATLDTLSGPLNGKVLVIFDTMAIIDGAIRVWIALAMHKVARAVPCQSQYPVRCLQSGKSNTVAIVNYCCLMPLTAFRTTSTRDAIVYGLATHANGLAGSDRLRISAV